MKKLILILLCFLTLTGCQAKPSSDSDSTSKQPVINLTPANSKENSTLSGDDMFQNNADVDATMEQTYLTNEASDPIALDRTVYQPGFSYEPLNEDIKDRITGISYQENPNITYDELRYVQVLYFNFNEEESKGELICNEVIAQDLVEIFYELYQAKYPIEKISLIDEYDGNDEASMADNNSSCFNYRVIAGTKNLSKHALGLAIDINPLYNPYITYSGEAMKIAPSNATAYADRDSTYIGKITQEDLAYRLFIEHGFTWGGDWKNSKDYQHFQKDN